MLVWLCVVLSLGQLSIPSSNYILYCNGALKLFFVFAVIYAKCQFLIITATAHSVCMIYALIAVETYGVLRPLLQEENILKVMLKVKVEILLVEEQDWNHLQKV